MRPLKVLAAGVAIVLSAAIGVVPAVGDGKESELSAGGSSVDHSPTTSQVPAVPAGAGDAIRDAVAGSGSVPVADTTAPSVVDPPVSQESGDAAGTPPATSPPSSAGATPVPETEEMGPARVTGLSFVLDLLEFGAELGPHEVWGLVVSALGTVIPTGDLPPALVDQAYTILAVPTEVFDQMAEPTMQSFAQLRASLEPLAASNEGANALIAALSDAIISAGTEGAALTNPLDAQVVQVGKFLLVLQEEG